MDEGCKVNLKINDSKLGRVHLFINTKGMPQQGSRFRFLFSHASIVLDFGNPHDILSTFYRLLRTKSFNVHLIVTLTQNLSTLPA